MPPELWLLPDWFPLHPGRWWCHWCGGWGGALHRVFSLLLLLFALSLSQPLFLCSRVVYLPMGYVYGRKATGKLTPLVLSLREELYAEPYEKVLLPTSPPPPLFLLLIIIIIIHREC